MPITKYVLKINKICPNCNRHNKTEEISTSPITIAICGNCGEFLMLPKDLTRKEKKTILGTVREIIKESFNAFCERCGQSKWINDENFIQYADVSGTETRYLDPETGEVVDYGDTNTEATGDSEYSCPNCNSSDIDFEWHGDEEEAKAIRESFNRRQETSRVTSQAATIAANIKNSEWDLESNSVHE